VPHAGGQKVSKHLLSTGAYFGTWCFK